MKMKITMTDVYDIAEPMEAFCKNPNHIMLEEMAIVYKQYNPSVAYVNITIVPA